MRTMCGRRRKRGRRRKIAWKTIIHRTGKIVGWQ